MSVGKDRVFLLSTIAELKTGYEQLFNAAKQFSTDVESKAKSVGSLMGQVPSEAKSSQLSGVLSGLKLEQDLFDELLEKLQRDVEKLQSDLPTLDSAAGSNVNALTSAADQLASLFQEYQSFIKGGFTAQDVAAFKKSLSKMRMQNGMKMSEIDKTLQQVLETSKGLSVLSAYYSADPVNLATGNFSAEKEDILIRGDSPLVFKRTYNAMDEYQGTLGERWVHSFEVKLEEVPKEKQLKIMMEDGCVIYYEETEENEYVSKLHPAHRLRKVSDGYQLITEDKSCYSFTTSGRWFEKETADGKKISLSYNENHQLKKVTSSSGHLRFRYNTEGYLILVRDHTNRKLQFDYNDGCLIKVIGVRKDELRYTYNEKKELIKTTNPRGIDLVQNEYDYLSRTTRQVFPDGGVMTYQYNDEEKFITVTEQNSNKITYHRDKDYRNTRVVYSDGEEHRVYNEQNKLVSFTDKRGNKTHYSYDDYGNMISSTNPIGETTTIKYSADHRPIEIKQATGGVFALHYEQGNLVSVKSPLKHETAMRYDDQNRPIEVTQPDGSQMSFTYDHRGNVLSMGLPNGGMIQYTYNQANQVICTTDANGNQTSFSYDVSGNLVTVVNAEGHCREYTYNEINKVTAIKDFDNSVVRYEYNELGKIASVTNALGSITEIEYDLMWNISKIKEPNGGETLYYYNQLNQLAKITNALGHETDYTYDPNGNITELSTPKQEKAYFNYDKLNRKSKIFSPDGHEMRLTYDKSGNIASMTDNTEQTVYFNYDIQGQLIEQTNVLGETTRFTYTPLGDVATIENPDGERTTYEYFSGGKLKKVTLPAGETVDYTYDLNGNVLKKIEGNEGTTSYVYDSLNQLVAITNPNGYTKKFSYDAAGRVVLFQDETGNITEYDYLPTGEMILVKDALGNKTTYDYDESGNLTTVLQLGNVDQELAEINELNHQTNYTYDLLGNVTSVTDGFGHKEEYVYDENNQLVKRIDKEGYQTQMCYAPNGQLSEIHYDDDRQVLFQYNELRQLVAIQDWLGKISMDLDALGRIKEVEMPDGQRIGYEWDQFNNRTKLIYPDGKEVKYEYNGSNKLTKLITGEQEYNYRYDQMGRLIEKQQPNQIVAQYQYDSFNQLTKLIHKQQDTILEKYTYAYDENGNKISTNQFRSGLPKESGQYHYSYDKLQRLTDVEKDGQSLRNYVYDTFGNRIEKNSSDGRTQYTYNALNQLIREESPTQTKSMIYDKRGNLFEEWVDGQFNQQYQYDATNMLAKVVTATEGEAVYQYDGLRNRIGQTIVKPNEPLKSIQYVLDLTKPYNNLLKRKENEETETYLWDQHLLALNEEEQFLLDDLGSPIRHLSLSGMQESFAYDEFGQHLTQPHRVFGFTGYQNDEVSGLNYAQARYYNQAQGRFVSEDNIKGLIEAPMTLNPYTYVWNRPLNLVDLDGNWPKILKDIGNGIKNTAKTVVDGAKKVVNTVKDSYDSLPNWGKNLVKIGVGVAAIGVGVAVTVATGGAAAPAIVAGLKTAAVMGGVSAGVSATVAGVGSVLSGDDFMTGLNKVGNAAFDGFCRWIYDWWIIMSGVAMSLNPILSKSNGFKIGTTPKPQYGKVTMGYGAENGGFTLMKHS
ncbi:DUF6531 domain-containing protein [uncultured Enterococcus sp.]|uniref:DUF6531 domain-containing protein n=1 Tax=uncultured Enterococcus sp. TaxID=167972 RepID=UPI002AA732E1|nr:DUF6531 domain-containing protein [uncultured Enterococcus sp.]